MKTRETREQVKQQALRNGLPQSTVEMVLRQFDREEADHKAAEQIRREYIAKMYDMDCD